jgi:hypothetical protein
MATGFNKRFKFSPAGEAALFAFAFLIIFAREIMYDSFFHSYPKYKITIRIGISILAGLIIFFRYRQRRRQQLRELRLSGMIAKQKAGL